MYRSQGLFVAILILVTCVMHYGMVPPGEDLVPSSYESMDASLMDSTPCPSDYICADFLYTTYGAICALEDSGYTAMIHMEIPCDSGHVYESFCLDRYTGLYGAPWCYSLEPFADNPAENSVAYIIGAYDPYDAPDITMEFASIQGAIWYYTNGFTPCTPVPSIPGCGSACPRSWDIIIDADKKEGPMCDRDLTVELDPPVVTISAPTVVDLTATVYNSSPDITYLENVKVTFTTDFGVFVSTASDTTEQYTDAAGMAYASLQADTAGVANVTAEVEGKLMYKLVASPTPTASQMTGMIWDTCTADAPSLVTFITCEMECPCDIMVDCESDLPEPLPTPILHCSCAGYTIEALPPVGVIDGCGSTQTNTFQLLDPDLNVVDECSYTITVDDDMPPELSCPGTITLECGDPVPPPSATATDNCSVPTVTYTDDNSHMTDCSRMGYIIRTYEAEDDCGNVATCTQVIIYRDSTPPNINCVEPLVMIGCDDDLPPPNATASDTCGTVTLTSCEDLSGLTDCNKTGTIIRTYTATDECNNTATCTQTIIVQDNIPPVINCPPALTVQCSEPLPPACATATDNCGTPALTFTDDLSGLTGCDNTGTVVRLYNAVDNCGNASTCVQTIHVIDTIAPVMTCLPDIEIDCEDPFPANVPTATDACDTDVSVTVDVTMPVDPNCGTAFRKFTATDDCGNSTVCVQKITINDTVPPVISCPPDITLECIDDLPDPLPSATATDNCGTPVICESVDGFLSPCGGTLTRMFTATDECGNSDSCAYTITVNDITDPEVSCELVKLSDDEDPDDENVDGIYEIHWSATDNCNLQNAEAWLDLGSGYHCDENVDVYGKGYQVEDGQLVMFKCSTDPDCNKPAAGDEDMDDEEFEDMLVLQGPSMTLTVSAEDQCGNTAGTVCEVKCNNLKCKGVVYMKVLTPCSEEVEFGDHVHKLGANTEVCCISDPTICTVIHTSCSKPIYVGMEQDGFVILELEVIY